MNTPLDDLYLEWLYSRVGFVEARQPSRTYWELLRQAYKMEFVWLIANDDNRIEDGKDLRFQFLDDIGAQDVDPYWLNLGCSVLELLIGLSKRLEFEFDGNVSKWFWMLIENLGLSGCTDAAYERSSTKGKVEDIFERLVWRQYNYDGSEGGLFPLHRCREDQRRVEIWYQLSAYMNELGN